MSDLSIVAVIPLYNGARFIEQSVRSVFAQTLQPDEFIVVDDGSSDGGAGAAIVERLAQERPVTLLHKPNGGQSSARNYGVAHSRSALIALLDQDDEWYPNHLQRLRRPFERADGAAIGWVYSNLDQVMHDGRMFSRRLLDQVPAEHPKNHLIRCLSEDMHVLPSASLIRREAFEAVGGFDERLSGYEDDDLFLRLFCASWRNVYLAESLSFWRMTEGSCSLTPRMAKSRMAYARKLLAGFPDERQRRIYFARDLIAPRFMRSCLANFAAALEHRDAELFRLALLHGGELLPHLSIRRRAVMLAILAAARIGAMHLAYSSRDYIRPIAARVMR